jgi:hypothetical protein
MIVEFSKKIIKELDESMASLDATITGGRPQNYAEYREVVGLRRGLMIAREHLEERTRAYMEAE